MGDRAWVSSKPWHTERPSKKLGNHIQGPFEILEKVGHPYRLKLLDTIQVHDVFPTEKLRKNPDDPLPGQENKEPQPISITPDDEWEVEKILAVK